MVAFEARSSHNKNKSDPAASTRVSVWCLNGCDDGMKCGKIRGGN